MNLVEGPNINFYKDKKIMVTGHTGFIGSWLSKVLSMNGAEICGYSLDPPTSPNLYEILKHNTSILDIRGDVRDRKKLFEIVSDFKPELVFHLAAQPIVLESYNNPVETFETNVTGTVNLLDILRKEGTVKVIVVLTSDKVYRNNERRYPYRETDYLGGKDPYSASKSCQDMATNSFRETYFKEIGVQVASIRAGNVIGGGDWGKHRLVPDIVRGITEEDVIKIRNPESTRPWQHIMDVISGILKLTSKLWKDPNFSGPWNFGPLSCQDIKVRDIVEMVIRGWGKGNYEIEKTDNSQEAETLFLDSSKAINLLEWAPKYDIQTSIRKTVEWYKEFYNNKDADIFTERQIQEYWEGE